MSRNVVQMISDIIKSYPERVAAVDENGSLTYGELDICSRKIAARLAEIGVKKGDFVTVELARSKEYLASVYAAMLVGAAFVPLDPSYPEERLRYIRSDCGAKAVVNDELLNQADSLAPFEGEAVFAPEDAALVIYTSGSTGKPKGVLLPQECISGGVERFAHYKKLPSECRCAINTAFTFIVTWQFSLRSLCSGWTAFIVPLGTMRDPVLLAEFFDSNKIDISFISPKMLRVFKPESTTLRYVHSGGEAVSGVYSDKFRIVVIYGQTETSGAVLSFDLDRKYESSPIGKAADNCAAYILDPDGNETDNGELCIAGVFAQRYLNLPEQSAKTFADNPFKEKDGFEKMVRTGDIVKRDGGNIFYLGRKDWMVKINGHRVEPNEIENVIKGSDGVVDAAVKDFKNSYGQVYLAAYIVGDADENAVRAAAGQVLPPYMIPAFFIKLDRLPTNTNGKLDRAALPEPEAGSFKNDYAAPETDIQKTLCEAFEKLLGVERIGADDDFFALGGDSIKTAMLSQQCAGIGLSASAVFDGRTPRGIERVLRRRPQSDMRRVKIKRNRVFPLSPSERGMYFEQLLDPDSTSYILNLAVTVKGADSKAVVRVLGDIFASHEAFRSHYGDRDGLPVRIIGDELPTIEEKTAGSIDEVMNAADSYAVPFDLSRIPAKAFVYTTPDGTVALHLAVHHIAFDGGSVKTFLRELIDGLEGGTVHSADIDLSDIELADSHQGMEFYRKMFFDGVPVNDMPIKGARPKTHPLSDRQITVDYSKEESDKLTNAAKRFGATRFELIFSAASMTVAKYAASQDVVLGVPTDMRPDSAEDVIGMFVNTAAVRVKPELESTLGEFVSSVSDTVRAATRSASLPFENVVSEFTKTRDRSRCPIFDVSVNYLFEPPVYDKNGLTVQMRLPNQRMDQDIAIIIRHNENGMSFDVRYSSELFDDSVIEGFSDQLRQTLSRICGGAKTVLEAMDLPGDITRDIPLTHSQNGIYVKCAAEPESTIYNIPYLFKLDDSVDTERLRAAAEAAINAHPYLKARLTRNFGGDIRARRNDDAAPVVELIDGELPEDLVKPFKLLDHRLYRVRIYRTPSGNYLYIGLHRIICDCDSDAVFIEDINSAYAGQALQAESFTGFDAAAASRSGSHDDAKAYYDSVFGGVDTDFLPSGDVVGGKTGSSQRLSIPTSLDVNIIKDYCEKTNVTPNAFFNSVFAFVLAKYSYKTEAVYTTIHNGRSDPRLARCVAMLAKKLPVYCALEGDTLISELIRSTDNQLAASSQYDLSSFADPSREVMFAYRSEGFAFGTIGGAPAEIIPLDHSGAKALLKMDVSVKDGKVFVGCDYRSDRYSEQFMRGFALCLETAAREFTVKKALKEVSVLGEDARKLIERFNATQVEIPHTTCNKLFERQVGLHPDKTAVIAGGESLTYTQLNQNANKVAHSLINGGVAVDEMVGVMVPRTVNAYAAREGVLKAGGAFMPLAPDYPDDRVSYILENSGAKHIVTTAETAEKRKALFDSAGVTVHTMESMLESDETDNPETGVQPGNLCYCIYTSGSTGKPKGVMIEHHSLVNFVHHDPINVQSCEFVDNMTVSLALAALTFDVSVLEETLGLYHGGTVAMATDEEINNPFLLAQMIERNGVDVMKCTPSYMNNMLDVPQVVRALCRMKAIDIGAEAFPAPLYDKMRRAGITAKIHNGYGPTEATITTSIDALTSNHITIGKPLCNTKVVMLDKYDHELPPDVPGELTILGECVGRGYVANEKLNAEKFITFGGYPAYRSGDLARRARDGKIIFMGRMDNQVKLRGLRIELDEIENVMNSYPSVTRSVVIVKESDTMGQFLCAYFAAGVKVDHDSLTAHLAKSLAKYMIPSVFVQLDAIPLTQNGKVDKKALPEPQLKAPQKDYVAPTTPLQEKLCAMFAYALGTEQVSVTDNFFEIGGTSLTASKIAMKAMTEKLPVAFKDIFDYPTVEAMERFINGKNQTTPEAKKALEKTAMGALCRNTARFVGDTGIKRDIGSVLLTGATGFLGIHVLKYIIDNTDKTVYCLLRGSSRHVEQRLKSILVYYFDDPLDELFGSRIIPVKGDITDPDSIFALKDEDFLTVINCAACVKHFSQDDTLDRINWHGVENLIDFCVKTNRRLVHISTVSVAGTSTADKMSVERRIHENELYIGQELDNKYANTKFKAEQVILKAVEDDGLDGKIIRVGNLMSRYSDGEFQINFVTNNFMRSIRAYTSLGMIPVSALDADVEFSPIDCTARAVVTLAATDKQFTVFHATNGHRVQMGDVAQAVNALGIPLEAVDDETFQKAFDNALDDEKMNEILSPLISYQGSSDDTPQFWIGHDNSFTTKALYRLGFKWPIINEKYLANAFEALETLGFFAVNN